MSLDVARGEGEGFVDAFGFEFGDPGAGAYGFCDAALFPNSGRLAVLAAAFDGETQLGVHNSVGELEAPANWSRVEGGGASIEVGEGSDRVRLEADGWGIELELTQEDEPAAFDAATEAGALTGAGTEFVACKAEEKTRGVRCRGARRRLVGAVDWSGISRTRALAVPFDDGGLLAIAAARPATAEGHGEEGLSCALSEPGGFPARPTQALLSTQYDAAGEHVRAGLELDLSTEEEDLPPLRGAATRLCGTRIERSGMVLDCAFFRWELDGRAGTGRYDIVTRA